MKGNIQMTNSDIFPSLSWEFFNRSEYTAELFGFSTALIQRQLLYLSVRAASRPPRGKNKSKAVRCGRNSALLGGPVGRELVLLHYRI